MKSRILLLAPLLACLAPVATAQNDKIVKTDGTVVADVKIESYDMRFLRYSKGNTRENLASEQVASIELGKFKDEFARGLTDPDAMVTIAREKLASKDQKDQKDQVLAQLGFLRAAELFLDAGKASEAMGTLDELAKGIPEAGVGLEAFRLRCGYYLGQGTKGAASAQTLAKKFQADATAKGWSAAALEGQFMEVLSSRAAPKEFQAALRGVVAAAGGNPTLGDRANVELAHSLRETKSLGEASKIYEKVAEESKDVHARAGAMLGMGKTLYEQAGDDKETYRKALLMFLRVRLETKDSWASLQSDALYHAILAADKWRGPEFGQVMARCRNMLVNEYPQSEWAERARSGR